MKSSQKLFSITHPIRGRVLRLGAPPVIEPGRGDILMAEPLLDPSQVRAVIQGICRRGRAKRVRAEGARLDSGRLGIGL